MLFISIFTIATQLDLEHKLFKKKISSSLVLNKITKPQNYIFNADTIGEELVNRMQKRLESDVGMRLILRSNFKERQREYLKEAIIPRLVNAGVIRRLFDENQNLKSVINFETFHSFGELKIKNLSSEVLKNIVLSIPASSIIESFDTTNLVQKVVEDNIKLVSFEALMPGEEKFFNIWNELSLDQILEIQNKLILNATGIDNLKIKVYSSSTNWYGHKLEHNSMARWLSILFPLMIAVASSLVLIFTFFTLINKIIKKWSAS